jgi:two-component system, chemotaxis family, CheB/CheR fusion protein
MSELTSPTRPRRPSDGQTVTLLAPTAQDAKYCKQILKEHGLAVETATCVHDLLCAIRSGAGVLLISQEFLSTDAMQQLRLATDSQPSWSDIPILVLLTTAEPSTRQIADLMSLGNVTLMARPLRIALLVSTLKAKLRDRCRQYEVRDLLQRAQQSNRSKSAFVANISHEIRTPMTSILGYAELMSHLVDNEEAQNYLSTIRRNGDFLLRIVNDILDLSKIEAEKLDINMELIEIARFLDDLHRDMEHRAHERGLDLTVEYASEIPEWIESDPKRLRQILINLIGNAIKFTDRGCVKVTVRFSSLHTNLPSAKSALGELEFSVSDTGIGMTAEQQDRLFKPFSQGNSHISQRFGGTGLGLAISQRLAHMLNGEISVNSQPDAGSTFTLKIKTGQHIGKHACPSKCQIASGPNEVSATDIQLDAHVMVVDDRRDIRFLSKRIVTMAGGEVTEAEDGVQAIDTFRRTQAQGVVFDAILLDMQMPYMDGYETAAELRKMGYANPIIALTADAMQEAVQRCLAAGCDYHLSKPIHKKRLLQLLGEVIPARSLQKQT